MHTYVYTYVIYIHAHCVYVCIYLSMCLSIYVSMYPGIHVSMYLCLFTHTHNCVHRCLRKTICACMRIFLQMPSRSSHAGFNVETAYKENARHVFTETNHSDSGLTTLEKRCTKSGPRVVVVRSQGALKSIQCTTIVVLCICIPARHCMATRAQQRQASSATSGYSIVSCAETKSAHWLRLVGRREPSY